jgi:hypothetical protein
VEDEQEGRSSASEDRNALAHLLAELQEELAASTEQFARRTGRAIPTVVATGLSIIIYGVAALASSYLATAASSAGDGVSAVLVTAGLVAAGAGLSFGVWRGMRTVRARDRNPALHDAQVQLRSTVNAHFEHLRSEAADSR